MERKPSCATTKSILFTVSKDECNTKEDIGESLKDALHCGMPKGTSYQVEQLVGSTLARIELEDNIKKQVMYRVETDNVDIATSA